MFSFLNKKKPIIENKELDNLLSFIRPLWWFESHVLSGYENTSSNIFFMPYESDLGIGFCLLSQETLKILERSDIEKYGKTEEQLLAISKKNLLDKSNEFSKESLFTEVSEGVWSPLFAHVSASGLMLLKSEINELSLSGQPLVFFMGKNQILITGSQDTKGILYCMLLLKQVEEALFITGNSYTLNKIGWNGCTFGKEKSGDIINEYIEDCMTSYMIDTNQFMNILEERNDTSDDFQISEITLGWSDDQSFLCTLWIEAKKNWLAKVDRIILAPLSGQNAAPEELDKIIKEHCFDWDVVANVYSHKMNQLDYFHEVWEFIDFPTEEEIKRMKKLQAQNDQERS